MTFPDALRRFRREYHLTQKDVANILGVQESAYQRYEQGRSLPSVAVVIKIADHFDISVDYLLGRTDDPNLERNNEKVDLSEAIIKHLRQTAYDSVDNEIKRLFPSVQLPKRVSVNVGTTV